MTLNQMLFGAFPYAVLLLAIAGTIGRYVNDRYSFSSLSSQFLENRKLFWGSVPWHYGLLFVLTGHLVGLLIPRSVLTWNGVPWRLYVLEGSALAFGLLTLAGLVMLIIRRATDTRVRAVTSVMDIVLLAILLTQVVAGLWTAIFYRWGSSWYAGFAVPYLVSLLTFNPDVTLVANLPWIVHVHIIGGFVIVGTIPFTRLAHLLFYPYWYLWRPYQVVIWNRKQPER